MTSLDFVTWLEDRLLNDDTTPHPHPPPPAASKEDSHRGPVAPGNQVMDIMWCYAQQYSSLGTVFPCCAILTGTKVVVERLLVTAEENGFAGVPELRPCVILPLGSIQQAVVGPCHSYLRLEEAFVGKGGLFTLFTLDSAVLRHFVDRLRDCCVRLDLASRLEILDLSLQSDVLRELCRREESLGLPSDRLAFTLLITVREGGEGKPCVLVLSENLVYCLDTACVYWPPPTFQTTHEDAIHLKVLKEFSIMDHIVDLALQTQQCSGQGVQGKVDFSPISLSMQVKSSSHQGELVFLFRTCSSRDSFLDRLTNLRAEHAHRMSPSFREAPEGGNENLDLVDCGQPSAARDAGKNPVAGNEVTGQRGRPSPPKVSITHPGSSLPSSFDWKGYYFHGGSDGRTVPKTESEAPESLKQVQVDVHNDLLSDIQSSGEVEEAAPTAFEEELREVVQTYELFHPIPIRLRPISLMSGREVVIFFHSKIMGSASSSAAPNEQSTTVTSAPEELRHVLWTTVVPYTDPSKEVVSLVMLSTRAIYLVSDSSATNPTSSARPSWMTHNRHKSDSAVGWHSKSPSPKGAGQGGRWSKVKPYAVLVLSELLQVSVGLFDQFLRLTGPTAQTVYTLATRDSRVTAAFVEKLKSSLSVMVSSPLGDKSPTDIEQDFYHAFAKRTNSTVEGLVYTHPSKVAFIYPGDDAIDDVLFLIKARIQASIVKGSCGGEAPPTGVGRKASRKEAMWQYILAYQLLPPFTDSMAAVPPERVRQRSVVITSLHLCLVQEDPVTYPLPDFVRGLPERPQHEVLDTWRLESLKRIALSPGNPHVLCLVFWDEPEELVVDTAMEHFAQGGREAKRKITPEVTVKLYVQSLRDKDKLVKTLQKQWRELVPQVGRILDVVRE